MSICLAVFTTDAQAIEHPAAPALYQFGEWRVVVQPGRVMPKSHDSNIPATSTVESISPRIQLTNHDGRLPPAPHPSESNPATETPIDPLLVTSEPDDHHAASDESTTADPPSSAAKAQLYREIYHSIPFSRAEFDANPSYRHDATMEILFGQLRPTVITRQRTSINVQMPAQPRVIPYYNWYGLHNAWSPYSYPPYRW